jgi:hypothetical protein
MRYDVTRKVLGGVKRFAAEDSGFEVSRFQGFKVSRFQSGKVAKWQREKVQGGRVGL